MLSDIKDRDNNKCKTCGSSEKLHVHHIDKNRKNNQVDNLITLCQSCHAKIHSVRIKRKSYHCGCHSVTIRHEPYLMARTKAKIEMRTLGKFLEMLIENHKAIL
jgi:hypothetical protein